MGMIITAYGVRNVSLSWEVYLSACRLHTFNTSNQCRSWTLSRFKSMWFCYIHGFAWIKHLEEGAR